VYALMVFKIFQQHNHLVTQSL